MSDDEQMHPSVAATAELVDQLRMLLAGHPPEVVCGALAECMAILLAGHHPAMRDEARQQMFQLAVELIPISIDEMREAGRYPAEWEDWKP